MGAVGDLLVRQLEGELAGARKELAKLKSSKLEDVTSVEPAVSVELPAASVAPVPEPQPVQPAAPPLVKQPALWFAVAGWAVAVVLLFRRRSI